MVISKLYNCMKHETLHTLRTCVSVDVYSHLFILYLLVIVNIKKHTFSELQPLLARLITNVDKQQNTLWELKFRSLEILKIETYHSKYYIFSVV